MKTGMQSLVLFALLFVATGSSAESFASPEAAKSYTDKIMDRVSAGDLEGGLKMIKPYSIVPAAEMEVTIGQAALQLPAITQRFGKPNGYELLSDKRVGSSLQQLQYLQKYERHGMRWTFFLFRGPDGWVINMFYFDDKIQELF